MLGISKDPLAKGRQLDTIYPSNWLFIVKLRSDSEAACKDATRSGNMSRLLNFTPIDKEIVTL